MTHSSTHFRVLIVDDNESIHEDLKKILDPRKPEETFLADEALLFGSTSDLEIAFSIDSAFQGREGLALVEGAFREKQRYALAFVDIRMPPGWDGVETITRLWRVDPDLQIVICTAHSDYNWTDIATRLGVSENFVILKKPFDTIEASQLAHALTAKWDSMQQARLRMGELDTLVAQRTEQLLSANQQLTLLSEALKAAGDSIAITDRTGTLVWTNHAFTSQSGYSADEAIGHNRRLLSSGTQDQDFYQDLWKTVLAGKVWRGEIVNRKKDGNHVTEEMTITPVSLNSADITHFVAINRDISERKKAEVELRRAEEKYRAMFEEAIIGMFQASPQGGFLKVNRSFARMHGYDTPEQLLADSDGTLAQWLVDPRQLDEWRATLAQAGFVRGAEVQIKRKDNTFKWVRVNLRMVPSAGGEGLLHDGTVEDITVRKLAQEQVAFLAYYDHLTGLPNRSMLKSRLSLALAEARRKANRVALLFLDLDRFKVINDSLGHSFGDMLLQEVGDRLRESTREQDTVSRVGGDEFLIVLTDAGRSQEIALAAERIMKSIGEEYNIQGRSLSISSSLGISVYPEHGMDEETLIKNADTAMYCAKEAGSNLLRFFTDEMNAQVVERMNLESSLRLALEREELYLEYQPQIDIVSGDMVGLEALIRWRHPELGLVSPDRFIRIAESSGLIIPIGEWVLKTACTQAKQWQRIGLKRIPMAVNVSAVQFRSEGFRDTVRNVLGESGLDAQYLELELTESLLLSNADVMFAVLQELKEMGLKLVIDDFGTGYSSLSYLRQFPVTKLKIDRSFIRDVANNPDDAAITEAIITMAKGLNMKVIAEGVETESQLKFLKAHGCDEGQGFFFSRPLIKGDVPRMFASHSSEELLPAGAVKSTLPV